MAFKELGLIIEGLSKELGLSENFILGSLRNKWQEIVGEGLSLHSEPFSIKNGELVIKVSSHLWAEEMRFYSDFIIDRLKPYGIRTVKFRIGRIASKDWWSGSRGRRFKEKRNGVLPHLPPELSEFVESSVSSINDETLRESIKKAMRRSLTVTSATKNKNQKP